MTKMIKVWMKSTFWKKVQDTCALFGTGTTIGLETSDINGFWSIFVAVITLIGYVLGIWFNDSDNDGIADIFQDIQPPK